MLARYRTLEVPISGTRDRFGRLKARTACLIKVRETPIGEGLIPHETKGSNLSPTWRCILRRARPAAHGLPSCLIVLVIY